MLIANSPWLSRTLADTAQTPGFPYGSPNLLDKMAFELSGIQAPTTPANPPPHPPPPKNLKFIACFFGNLFARFQSLEENGGGYISF